MNRAVPNVAMQFSLRTLLILLLVLPPLIGSVWAFRRLGWGLLHDDHFWLAAAAVVGISLLVWFETLAHRNHK